MSPRRLRRVLLGVSAALAASVAGAVSYQRLRPATQRGVWVDGFVAAYQANPRARTLSPQQCAAVVAKARAQVSPRIQYDPAYVAMPFPSGDVPANTGVCADLVVRALRAASVDLQEAVHGDIKRAPDAYPNLWNLRAPDPNIDHRRVPNLMVYFSRHAAQLPLSHDAKDYQPCDVVAWDLGKGVTHLGLVSDRQAPSGRPLMLHHLSGSPTEEDVLFDWRLIGHFGP